MTVPALRSTLLHNRTILTEPELWVRIFLAAKCEPVLTARFGRVVGGYEGEYNKHKLRPGQINPPASSHLIMATVSMPIIPTGASLLSK